MMSDHGSRIVAAAADRRSAQQGGMLPKAILGGRRSAIFHVALVAAAVAFALSLPFFTRGSSGTRNFTQDLLQHAFVLGWMLIATVRGRTLPLRTMAAFFFVGLFGSVLVVYVVGYAMAGLTRDDRLFDSLLVPLLEEAVKIGPVALFLWFISRRGWQPSMTDGLLLGFMVGGGMAIYEDGLYQRVYGLGMRDSVFGLIFPTIGEQSTLSRVEVYGLYHSGWASVTGLATGAWLLLRRRYRLTFLLPTAAFVVVVLDHGVGNYIIGNQGPGGLSLLWTLNLNGMLPIFLLLVAIPVAIAAEILILRRQGRIDRVFLPFRWSALPSQLSSGLGGLQRLQHARIYGRARRSLHYLIWSDPGRTASRARLEQTMRTEAAALAVDPQLIGITVERRP